MLNTNSELYKTVLYSLASLYEIDLNDPVSAFPLWQEAANLGDPKAQYNLGIYYLKGMGTAKDTGKAREAFTKALSNGIEDAQRGLDLIKQAEEIDEMKRRQQSVQEHAQRVQGRGCYIATAIYGSYDCPEVWVLRRYRDYNLSSTEWGRAFIKLYYTISPTCVKYFGSTKVFNCLFKSILDKTVKKLRKKGYDDSPYCDEG